MAEARQRDRSEIREQFVREKSEFRRLWDIEKADIKASWQTDKDLLAELRKRAVDAETKLSALVAETEMREKAFEEERASLKALTEDVQQRFQSLADGALRKSQSQFLELADQHLKKHKEGAEGQIKTLIKPIEESFGQFRQKVDAIQKVSAEDRATLQTQFKSLMENMSATQATTAKLANALSAPKSGGRWGEETLRNVLEMAGLSAHVDFTEQTHSATETGAIRPDVTISMPGGRQLVIDAKVSVDDFLRASEESDPERQAQFLAAHARKVREHVKTLGQKAYWSKLSDAVDFVAMFIPGENFYAAALEHDRDLFDFAAKNKVIIVTPSTLIALAKAVAYGWRQEEAAENAREVTDMARELYGRIATLGEKVVKLGRNIGQSATSYNELVGSLESKVLPQARKFEAMGMDADGKAIPDLEEVDIVPRDPKRGKDLLFDGDQPEQPKLPEITDRRRRKRAS